MSFIGHYSSWPLEVGNVKTGVVYQVRQDGRVYRLEPSDPGLPGRVQLIGTLTQIPATLPEMWDACEAIYWEEITVIPVAWEDLTPIKPVSGEMLAATAAREER